MSQYHKPMIFTFLLETGVIPGIIFILGILGRECFVASYPLALIEAKNIINKYLKRSCKKML